MVRVSLHAEALQILRQGKASFTIFGSNSIEGEPAISIMQ